MYAVIRTGGKQQKVKPGDVIEVELLHADGDTVTFQPLLVVDDDGTTHVGKDVQRAVVTAKLLGEQKGDKVNVFKYKSKSGYSRRQGHRQLMTLLEISEVKLPAKRGTSKASEKPED
jgi:large subunit ribosomal protein L21